MLVGWLTSTSTRFSGTSAFGHAFKLFADGSSMLGFAADHLRLEFYPAGSFLIEQGEPVDALYCLLAGSVDVVVEEDDGTQHVKDHARAGSFVGEDGLATGRPRNAHVVAREDVTSLVLTPRAADLSAPGGPSRGGRAASSAPAEIEPDVDVGPEPDLFIVDVTRCLERKVAALVAHRSQYALEPGLLPDAVLQRLLGVEHFALVAAATPGAAS